MIFGGDFSILKLFLKLLCYHDNYFQYFTFRKHNGFVSKARVSACMYFLVIRCSCKFQDHAQKNSLIYFLSGLLGGGGGGGLNRGIQIRLSAQI